MIITYADGQTVEAALVVRTDKRMRVALAGSEDLTEFTQINGVWVSEDLEPAHIEFGFQSQTKRDYTEDDFACSKELAARLIHLLLNPEADEELAALAPMTSLQPAADLMVM